MVEINLYPQSPRPECICSDNMNYPRSACRLGKSASERARWWVETFNHNFWAPQTGLCPYLHCGTNPPVMAWKGDRGSLLPSSFYLLVCRGETQHKEISRVLFSRTLS